MEAHIEELPFEDASFDAVISNGVINLSPLKGRVFAEAARVLRPGGRLAISDIVSGRALKERTRRNVDLWAACIAGAVPRKNYLEAIAAQGLQVEEVRSNDYHFTSERALEACSIYEVQSISLVAARPGRTARAACCQRSSVRPRRRAPDERQEVFRLPSPAPAARDRTASPRARPRKR